MFRIPLNDHGAGSMLLEITWSVIPLLLSLVMFGWGALIFFDESKPPADAMDIWVVGKQWMWKIQHLEGAREINELHIPGQPQYPADPDVRRRHP